MGGVPGPGGVPGVGGVPGLGVYLVQGGVPGLGGVPGPGVYLVLGGVPGPGGCTWSRGVPDWGGTWSGGCTCPGTPPCEQNHRHV